MPQGWVYSIRQEAVFKMSYKIRDILKTYKGQNDYKIMPDNNTNFHEFALKSILFKGQYDLYFCYVKSEKIAHVLTVLQSRSGAGEAEHLSALVAGASRLPETIAHFAAGEMELSVVLADILSLLSAVRLGTTQNILRNENAQLIVEEYEGVAQRLSGGGRLSPFVTSEDFLLPPMPEEKAEQSLGAHSQSRALPSGERRAHAPLHVKDSKGQSKGHMKEASTHKPQIEKRTGTILAFVRKQPASSIKDISRVVKGCSEKTIQRELALLIEQGLVEKRGERRWSVYYPI